MSDSSQPNSPQAAQQSTPAQSPAQKTPPPTLVYTRCIFFRHQDTTVLERQVNYFLTYAPLAELHQMETNPVGEEVLITLWIEPMPEAAELDAIYAAALSVG